MQGLRLRWRTSQLKMGGDGWLLVGVLLIHLWLLVNLKFTVWPEMMLYPWLWDRGFGLYRDLVNPYFPGLTWALWGWFKVFGWGFLQLKVLAWLVILVTDWLVYRVTFGLTRRKWAAFTALGFWVIWQPVLEGQGLWYDLVLAPFLLMVVWLGATRVVCARWWVGLLLAVMVLIKQSAGWFLVAASLAAMVELWFEGETGAFDFAQMVKWGVLVVKRLVSLWLPTVVMMVMVGGYFWGKGTGEDFFLWTIRLPLGMVGQLSGHVLGPTAGQLGVIGLIMFFVLTLILRSIRVGEDGGWGWMWWMWLASWGLAYPRFSFFHLQPWLAVTAVMVGVAISKLRTQSLKLQLKSRNFLKIDGMLAVSLMVGLVGVLGVEGWFYQNNWRTGDRFLERGVYRVVEFLEREYPGEKVAVINGPQLVYFLLGSLPGKPWVDNFPWYMEVGGVQERVIMGMEETGVEVVVTRWVEEEDREWKIGRYYPGEIAKYLEENYNWVVDVGDYEVWERG